jgi:lipopolysaccharide export LptBFGC system permease protein LptF
MRKIDRYFLSEMLVPALMGVMLLLVLLVGNVLYGLLMLLYSGAPAREVFLVLWYRTPGVLMEALPGALLLGTALALNRLERDRELQALRMAGIRLKRLVLPYLGVAALGVGVLFMLQERVIPYATHQAARLTNKLSWGSPTAVVQQDMVFRVENDMVYIHRVDPNTKTLYGVVVCQMKSGYPTWLVIPRAENHDGVWKLLPDPATGVKPRVYTFTDTGDLAPFYEAEEGVLNLRKDMLDYVTDQPGTPAEMTLAQLLVLQKDVRGAGFGFTRSVSLKPNHLAFYVQRRFAAPLAALVAVLIAIPLSIHFGRNGGYVGLLLSVIVAFFFVVSQQWAQVLALTDRLHPLIAAWAPNAAFGLLGLVLLLREE